jgi:hypothetical protein
MIDYKLVTRTPNPKIFHSWIVNDFSTMNVEYILQQIAVPPKKLLDLGFGLFLHAKEEIAQRIYNNNRRVKVKTALLKVEYDLKNVIKAQISAGFLTDYLLSNRYMSITTILARYPPITPDSNGDILAVSELLPIQEL